MAAKRNKYTAVEERKIELRAGNPDAKKKSNARLWEVYKRLYDTEKNPPGLDSHYRRQMLPKICEASLPKKDLFLLMYLHKPVLSEDDKERLETRFNVRVETDERGQFLLAHSVDPIDISITYPSMLERTEVFDESLEIGDETNGQGTDADPESPFFDAANDTFTMEENGRVEGVRQLAPTRKSCSGGRNDDEVLEEEAMFEECMRAENREETEVVPPKRKRNPPRACRGKRKALSEENEDESPGEQGHAIPNFDDNDDEEDEEDGMAGTTKQQWSSHCAVPLEEGDETTTPFMDILKPRETSSTGILHRPLLSADDLRFLDTMGLSTGSKIGRNTAAATSGQSKGGVEKKVPIYDENAPDASCSAAVSSTATNDSGLSPDETASSKRSSGSCSIM